MRTRVVGQVAGCALTLSLLGLGAQVHASAVRKQHPLMEAFEEYRAESAQFLDVMRTTRVEMRTWRSNLLAERFESKLKTIESELTESNVQILKEVERSIKENGVDGLDDVLLMRTAQLYFEKESLSLVAKMKSYEADMKAYFEGRNPQPPQMPVPNYQLAIDFAGQLIRRYPRSPLSDRAHYIMAYANEEMGRQEEARKVYLAFLAKHPFSPLSDEVRWRLAEFYFDTSDYARALLFYTQLAQSKNSPFRLKAVYKQAATLFTQKKYSQAGLLFLNLYEQASVQVDLSRENETLVDESLEYIGIIRGLGVDLKISQSLVDQTTRRLAQAYQRLPDEARARSVYVDFVARNPASPQLPFFSDEVIRSFLGDGILDRAEATRDAFVMQLTRDRRWWNQNRENRKSVFEAEDLLESYLMASAQSHAQRGYDRNDKAELQIARDQYQRFLAAYPFSPLVGQARYELAQVEYFSGLFPSARENFEALLNDPQSSEWHDQSAYGLFLAVSKQVGYGITQTVNLEPKRGSRGELLPPQKISDRESAVLAAAGRAAPFLKPGERRQTVMFKVAEIHFGNNNFDAAEKAVEAVLSEEGDSLVKARAIRLSAEIANLRGDWKKVAERNSQLETLSLDASVLKQEGLQASDLSDQSFRIPRELEQNGRIREAAEEYERQALAFPKSQSAPLANFKAAELYRKESQFKASDQALGRLTGTRYEEDALFIRAQNAQSILDYGRAVKLFTDYLARYPKSNRAPEAAYKAATLLRDLRKYSDASHMMMRYYAYAPTDGVLADAIELAGKAGDPATLRQLVKRLQQRDGEARWRARLALAEATWRRGDVKGAGETCRETYAAAASRRSTSAIVERAQRVCRLYEASLLVRQGGASSRLAELEKAIGADADLVTRLKLEKAKALAKSGNDRQAAIKLAQEALTEIRGNVFSSEGKELYDFLRSMSSTPSLHVGTLFPWHLIEGHQVRWATPTVQQLTWGDVRSLCDREQYGECVTGAEAVAKAEPNEDLQFNLILAYLRSSRSVEGRDAFLKFGQTSGWSPVAIRLGWNLGFQSALPLNSKIQLAQESRPRAESYAAEAARLLEERKFRDALQRVNLALYEDSSLTVAYVLGARIFQETGNFELMREAFRKGAESSKSRSALFGLMRVMEALTNAVMSSSLRESTELFDARALYGQAFAAWWTGDTKTLEGLKVLLEKRGSWSEDFTSFTSLLSGGAPGKGLEGSQRKSYVDALVANDPQALKKGQELGMPTSFWLRDLAGGGR